MSRPAGAVRPGRAAPQPHIPGLLLIPFIRRAAQAAGAGRLGEYRRLLGGDAGLGSARQQRQAPCPRGLAAAITSARVITARAPGVIGPAPPAPAGPATGRLPAYPSISRRGRRTPTRSPWPSAQHLTGVCLRPSRPINRVDGQSGREAVLLLPQHRLLAGRSLRHRHVPGPRVLIAMSDVGVIHLTGH